MNKILFSTVVAALIFVGCGEEKSSQKVEEQKSEVPATSQEKFVTQVKDSASQVASTIAQESKKLADAGQEAAKSVTEDIVQKSQEIKEQVIEHTNQAKDKIDESINNIVATKSSVDENSTSMLERGKALYLKCAGCHGPSAKNPALGKSQVINGWTKEQVLDALKGYKNDTYGGALKGVMKSQLSTMSDSDMEAVSEYIATF